MYILSGLGREVHSTLLPFGTLLRNDAIIIEEVTMGAKPKLNEEKIKIMVDFIKEGNYDSVAANAAGISRQTFYRYIRKGKEDREGIYYDFYQAVEQAKAEGEVALLKTVKAASQRTWQAAAWMLERSRPDRWALQKSKQSVAGLWKKEILEMLKSGDATPEDVVEVLGEELAYELFDQAGITLSGRGKTEKESVGQRSEQTVQVPE